MVKKLDGIPLGTAVFMDANIFQSLLEGCARFLERVRKGR
jgi:hypothetical protein